MKMKNFCLPIFIMFALTGCDTPHSSGITSSSAVGGEFDTMQQCKNSLDKTAQKYNVSYTVDFDERDYFSGKIVKDGIQSDLLVACDKKSDYFSATFEIPD